MRKVLNVILLGTILLCLAFPGYAGDEQAAPTQDKQERKAAAALKGTAPRESAARYPVHGELDGVAIGAALLTPDEVQHAFTTDLNRCCSVVEVALYPDKGKALEIAREDFTFRVAGTHTPAKPAGPNLLALTLQQAASARRDISPSGSVGVVYGTGGGYDPTTGQTRGRGVSTSVAMGVGVGGSGGKPASTGRAREIMEAELSEKGLPEGIVSAPVAGYLYFPLTTKKKKAARQLEYTLAGQNVVLALP